MYWRSSSWETVAAYGRSALKICVWRLSISFSNFQHFFWSLRPLLWKVLIGHRNQITQPIVSLQPIRVQGFITRKSVNKPAGCAGWRSGPGGPAQQLWGAEIRSVRPSRSSQAERKLIWWGIFGMFMDNQGFIRHITTMYLWWARALKIDTYYVWDIQNLWHLSLLWHCESLLVWKVNFSLFLLHQKWSETVKSLEGNLRISKRP